MLNRVSKNHIMKNFQEKNPARMAEVKKAYKEMVIAFDASQDILNSFFYIDIDVLDETTRNSFI